MRRTIITIAVLVLAALFIGTIYNRQNKPSSLPEKEWEINAPEPEPSNSLPGVNASDPLPEKEREPTAPVPSNITPGDYIREMDGWQGRPYTLHIPTGYDPSKQYAVVLALHGGGANSGNAAKVTCPDGDVEDPKCLSALADTEGFIVVYPNGTANPGTKEIRTWNAGGGTGDYLCVSGYACKNNVDDIAYFQSLLNEVEGIVSVDTKRVFATGISNGGAMSHRLACELSDRIAAIASIAGGNQFAAASSCSPSRPVPVLQIHGTDDPAWPYLGGQAKRGGELGIFSAAPQAALEWASRNGCGITPRKENLPDAAQDGTTIVRESYTGCRDNADVVFLTVNGGGHTWPQGNQYFTEFIIGKTSQELNANETIWEFFKMHPMTVASSQ